MKVIRKSTADLAWILGISNILSKKEFEKNTF